MAFFKLGKKSKKVPDLPELPPLEAELPEFPSFKPVPRFRPEPRPLEKSIKEAITPPPKFPEPEFTPRRPLPRVPEPVRTVREEPLFVKIDKYKDAMGTLLKIKAKLKEAEDTLTELRAVRDREEKEMADWHDRIDTIKEKLLQIDKELFEGK